MTVDEFWKLIDATKKSDPDEHVEKLIGKLSKLPPDTILEFGQHWRTLHSAAYTWKLWGAAYIINGGCSDDGFIDFRSWLLLKGEPIYTAALADADSLSKVRVEEDEAQCECYPAPMAYEKATESPDHEAFYEAYSARFGESGGDQEEPAGENWDFDDEAEMKKRLPKLWKKFSDS
ncbi:MAG: DUF4240 domain-containing protein [Gemmataceae bacterium]